MVIRTYNPPPLQEKLNVHKLQNSLIQETVYPYSVLGTRHIFVDASRVTASCRFTNASRVTAMFFQHFFRRHCFFVSRVNFSNAIFFNVLNVHLLKLVSTPTPTHSHLYPSWRSYPTLLLAINLHPFPWRPSHPSWRSTSIPPVGQTNNLRVTRQIVISLKILTPRPVLIFCLRVNDA